MKTYRSNENSFHKIVAMGSLNYCYNLNLTKDEAFKMNFNFDKVNTIKDVLSILDLEDLKNRIILDSSHLVTFLAFINKTNSNKLLAEYLSLNLISIDQDLIEFQEKIKNDFDDNFLFLFERDILSKRNLSLRINVEGKSAIFSNEGKSLPKF